MLKRSSRTRCWTVVVFMDMVTFVKVFMVGFFVVTNLAIITDRIWCPSTRLEHQEEHKLRATCCCDTYQIALKRFQSPSHWQSESDNPNGDVHRYTLSRTLISWFWLSDALGTHSAHFSTFTVQGRIEKSFRHLCICAMTHAVVWQYDVTPSKHRLWAQRLYQRQHLSQHYWHWDGY